MSSAIFDDFKGRNGNPANLPSGLTATTATVSGAVSAGSVSVGSAQLLSTGVNKIGAGVIEDTLGYVPAQATLPVEIAAVLTAADAAAGDHYGTSVALSSDASVLAVGAHRWEGSSADQGGVYVYDWSGSEWVQRGSVLTAGDAAGGDRYGRAVALSSDASVLAVGAHAWEGSSTDQGAVYTYATASSLQSATQRLLSYIQSLSARIAALGG